MSVSFNFIVSVLCLTIYFLNCHFQSNGRSKILDFPFIFFTSTPFAQKQREPVNFSKSRFVTTLSFLYIFYLSLQASPSQSVYIEIHQLISFNNQPPDWSASKELDGVTCRDGMVSLVDLYSKPLNVRFNDRWASKGKYGMFCWEIRLSCPSSVRIYSPKVSYVTMKECMRNQCEGVEINQLLNVKKRHYSPLIVERKKNEAQCVLFGLST